MGEEKGRGLSAGEGRTRVSAQVKGVGERHELIANKEEGAVSLKRMKWVKPQTSKLL